MSVIRSESEPNPEPINLDGVTEIAIQLTPGLLYRLIAELRAARRHVQEAGAKNQSLVNGGYMAVRRLLIERAELEARIAQLEQVREAAQALVETWGDGPKDVSGDSTVEGDLRIALAAMERSRNA